MTSFPVSYITSAVHIVLRYRPIGEPESFSVTGSSHSVTERIIGGDTSLQELVEIAVFHVLEHGIKRLFLTTDSKQSHDVCVLQIRHCLRVLMKLRPTKQAALYNA